MKRAFLVVACLALVAACGSSDGPTQVSDNFWGALVEGDVETARTYATPETAGNIQADGGGEGEYTLGGETIDGDTARVATTLVSQDGDMSMTVDLQTVLVRQGGAWRVDVDQTMMSMFGGAMGAMMQEMGDAMQEAMGEMATGMEQGMQQMAEEMAAQNDSGTK